jgi:signal transduction histidine kinase
VSRSLAESNGGALVLDDAAPGGARFTLTMPLATMLEPV